MYSSLIVPSLVSMVSGKFSNYTNLMFKFIWTEESLILDGLMPSFYSTFDFNNSKASLNFISLVWNSMNFFHEINLEESLSVFF